MPDKVNQLISPLHSSVKALEAEFHLIPNDRRKILLELAGLIKNKVSLGKVVNLNFICTHNSRRSQIAQLWAQAAAHFYGVPHVMCFSGGTEATAFNLRAVKAMQAAGFEIIEKEHGSNPRYQVTFAANVSPLLAFSKKYDDSFNAGSDFAAVMTCAQADENCPVVVGASARFALTYDDPKEFDGTPTEETMYAERVSQIGREMLFAFAQVNPTQP